MIAFGAAFAPLHWAPALPAWFIAMILGGALCGAILSLVKVRRPRRTGLLALRIIALVAIGALLFDPSTLAPATVSQKPSLTLLIDTSRSMGVTDGSADGAADTRLEALRDTWLGPDMLDRLARLTDLRMFAFADRVSSLERSQIGALRPDGESTRLTDALEASLTALRAASSESATSGAGRVLVLSDARDSAGRTPASMASLATSRGVRVDFVPPDSTLSSDNRADVSITATPQEPLVAAGAPTAIELTVTQRGFDGQSALVVLRQTTPVQRELARRQVTLGRDEILSFDVTPALAEGAARGVHSIECIATIESFAAESDTMNNADPFFLQVTDGRVRVVVFEGEPSWDSRFFVASLADDPRFEVTTVHALGRRAGAGVVEETIRTRRITPGVARTREQTGLAPPVTSEALSGFDVVALGRRVEAIFPGEQADLLRRFAMEDAGALVLLRGDPFSDAATDAARDARIAMAPLLPLTFIESKAPPTSLFALADGVRALGPAATTIEAAPEVDAIARISDLSALAAVWLAGFDTDRNDVAPALLRAPAGRGRVLINLAEGFWRWQMLPPDQREWRRALAEFWPQALLALVMGSDWAPGQSVSLAADRVVAEVGEDVLIVVRARGPLAGVLQPVVEITASEEGSSRSLALNPDADRSGMWTGVLSPEQSGVLTIRLPAAAGLDTDLVARVRVRETTSEMRDTTPARAQATALADATGGRVFAMDDVGAYIELIESEALAGSADSVLRPVWRQVWVFWLLVGVLALEWFWRRWSGLS